MRRFIFWGSALTLSVLCAVGSAALAAHPYLRFVFAVSAKPSEPRKASELRMAQARDDKDKSYDSREKQKDDHRPDTPPPPLPSPPLSSNGDEDTPRERLTQPSPVTPPIRDDAPVIARMPEPTPPIVPRPETPPTADVLLAKLEQLKAQKQALDKHEAAVRAELKQRLEAQQMRMKALRVEANSPRPTVRMSRAGE